MIQIYGSPMSSAGRCYVMLEECGVPYQIAPMNMKNKDHKSPDYLKLNPNGKVPTLVDDGFVIWESLAINHYLAEKYKPELLGKSLQDRALVQQWSVWSMTELQPPMVDLLIQMMFVPEDKRNQQLIEKSKAIIPEKIAILNKALEGKTHLVAHQFTAADLNAMSVADIGLHLKLSYSDFPQVMRWMELLKKRPSFAAVAAKGQH